MPAKGCAIARVISANPPFAILPAARIEMEATTLTSFPSTHSGRVVVCPPLRPLNVAHVAVTRDDQRNASLHACESSAKAKHSR